MTGPRRAGGPRPARACPWPGCSTATRALMCRPHWFMVPAALRARILATVRPGQTALTASPEYLEALRDVLTYARESEAAGHGGPVPQADRPAACPDGCGHRLSVHSADSGCWLCACAYGYQRGQSAGRR
jgi:hypothetical protein